jgi:hypothetical protein
MCNDEVESGTHTRICSLFLDSFPPPVLMECSSCRLSHQCDVFFSVVLLVTLDAVSLLPIAGPSLPKDFVRVVNTHKLGEAW